MKTGYRGTFVISWTQTEVDGIVAAPQRDLNVGSSWVWRGDAIRVDGPSDRLRLDTASDAEQTRKRAARMVHKLVGAAVNDVPAHSIDFQYDDHSEPPLRDSSIVLSDGAHTYTGTVVDVRPDTPPLIMFLDQVPLRNRDLWVVHTTLIVQPGAPEDDAQGGVICFTPDTRILTEHGELCVQDLTEGTRIQTKDSGLQPVEWIGSRHMTGARLFAMPWLRPIRMQAGALGLERPDAELLVSAEHRVVVNGPIAQDLFNENEVLVAAKDLVNGQSVFVDHKSRNVTYIHLLLPKHEIIWANGLETESFHPASAPLASLADVDRERLLARYPHVARDVHSYGTYARRSLSTSEAAILQHAA